MPPKSTRTFAFLTQAFGKFAGAADDADAAPSPDAQFGFKVLLPLLDSALADWQKLKRTDLAAVNGQLRAAGKPELKLVGE